VIQFRILSGKQAGSEIVARRFPFVIGRGQADLALDEAGVWEQHLQIDFERGAGFTFVARSEALAVINGAPVETGLLRNGDVIELGSASLRAWLTPARQKTLRHREFLTWALLLALFVAQAGVIYLLWR
jgi:hypothetical protein